MILSDSQKEEVKTEIRSWSKQQLESPNADFNNIPACPYAKKAWDDDKVKFAFKTDFYSNDIIYDYLKDWDDAIDLVIFIDTAFLEEAQDFYDNVDFINENISENAFKDKDLWIMGFHPYDDANELIDDGTFEGASDIEYAIIFVQRLSKLQEASNKLVDKGYYDHYFKTNDVSEMYEIRKEYYRRLDHGNGKESRAS